MTVPRIDYLAREVLRRYPPALGRSSPVPLGNGGGFSGARLWRMGECCLRAWPAGEPDPERLTAIHRWMIAARAAGLSFVPEVFPTPDGFTWTEYAGHLWEVTTWMPGRADFHDKPTRVRLQNALTALARLHAVWAQCHAAVGPSPAIRRRLQSWQEWTALLRSGWRPVFSKADPVAAWAERAWQVVPPRLVELPHRLAPWQERSLPLQPCLCDVWHDHLLFEGDALTGLIDFGSVKVDHVAVDLARLLGSLVSDDAPLRALALEAYRRLRPLSVEEEVLVQLLDETGTLLGAANWLRWLYHEGRRCEDRDAVARRLAARVERVERW